MKKSQVWQKLILVMMEQKNFFEQNKDKFTFYTQINANIYLSNNPQTLENIKNTKKQSLNHKMHL